MNATIVAVVDKIRNWVRHRPIAIYVKPLFRTHTSFLLLDLLDHVAALPCASNIPPTHHAGTKLMHARANTLQLRRRRVTHIIWNCNVIITSFQSKIQLMHSVQVYWTKPVSHLDSVRLLHLLENRERDSWSWNNHHNLHILVLFSDYEVQM